MPTNSHFWQPLHPGGWLDGLFPDGVAVRESRVPGDAAALLPAEAQFVATARPKRVQEFAAGRACAKAALAQFGFRDFALLPAADRQPLWPPGFVGSITHTAGLCMAAVAPRSHLLAIGLDAEIVGAPTPDLWTTLCGDEELRWVRSLGAADQPAAVTLIFAAKEAFYKCQYPLVGEWLDFHDLRVEALNWGVPHDSFSVAATRELLCVRDLTLPLLGRYAFQDTFIAAGIGVPAGSPRQ